VLQVGPNEVTRVLILWADNSAANYGLRVLAAANELLVAEAFRDHTVQVECQDFGPGDSKTSFGTKSIIRNIIKQNGPIDTKLRGYDLVVDTGAGDSFADIYGLKRLSFIVYAHSRIKRLSIPLVMAPQTIGPFETRLGRFFARRSLRYAELVVARDSESEKYCRHLGRVPDLTATDVVFGLPAHSGQSEKLYDVILNISGLLWFADEHGDSRKYITESMALVKQLRLRGRRVTVLPHVNYSQSGNDDIDASKELVKRLAESDIHDVAIYVPEDLSAARTVISGANVVIGARMHACLNALSLGTPTIPWAYSRKFVPLLNDLGWRYVIDLKQDVSPAMSTIQLLADMEGGQSSEIELLRKRAEDLLHQYVSLLSETIVQAPDVCR
jgi:colanic acid/amylovoran biosynthesis protein